MTACPRCQAELTEAEVQSLHGAAQFARRKTHPGAPRKLSDQQVAAIRLAKGRSLTELAAKYNVSRSLISRVRSGQRR